MRTLLSRLTVRQKFTGITTLVLALYVLSHGFMVRTLETYRVGGSVYQSLKQEQAQHDVLQGLLNELNAARAALYLLFDAGSEDRARQLAGHWRELAQGVDAHFARAHALPRFTASYLPLAEAEGVWRGYKDAVEHQVLSAPAAERDRRLHAFVDGAQMRRHQRLVELLETSTNALRLSTAELERQSEAGYAQARGWTGAIALVLLVALAALLTAVGRSITRPLRRLVQQARQLEAGELATEVGSDARDEVGQLARAFGAMVRQLRAVLGQVREASQALEVAVARIAEAADQQHKSTERQAAALEQTHVTAQEIRTTSELAARQAAEVLAGAERADQVGRSGVEALAGSLGGIQDIRARIDEIAQRVVLLGEKSVRVAAITDTVKDLADQSHVLALNAAIEAARAGHDGQGFAVVAREIRTLADQSVQATLEVRKQLQATSGEVRQTVRITEEGRARVEAGLAQVRTSAERLEELTAMLQRSAHGVRQIAAAVDQQHRGVDQIFGAVHEVSRGADAAVQGVAAVREQMRELEELTRRLSASLAGFQL